MNMNENMNVFMAWIENSCLEFCQDLICNNMLNSFPVAQLVEHGASNAKIMGSIPRESKS